MMNGQDGIKVRLSIPRDAALRLKLLAESGSPQLTNIGILMVDIKGFSSVNLPVMPHSWNDEMCTSKKFDKESPPNVNIAKGLAKSNADGPLSGSKLPCQFQEQPPIPRSNVVTQLNKPCDKDVSLSSPLLVNLLQNESCLVTRFPGVSHSQPFVTQAKSAVPRKADWQTPLRVPHIKTDKSSGENFDDILENVVRSVSQDEDTDDDVDQSLDNIEPTIGSLDVDNILPLSSLDSKMMPPKSTNSAASNSLYHAITGWTDQKSGIQPHASNILPSPVIRGPPSKRSTTHPVTGLEQGVRQTTDALPPTAAHLTSQVKAAMMPPLSTKSPKVELKPNDEEERLVMEEFVAEYEARGEALLQETRASIHDPFPSIKDEFIAQPTCLGAPNYVPDQLNPSIDASLLGSNIPLQDSVIGKRTITDSYCWLNDTRDIKDLSQLPVNAINAISDSAVFDSETARLSRPSPNRTTPNLSVPNNHPHNHTAKLVSSSSSSAILYSRMLDNFLDSKLPIDFVDYDGRKVNTSSHRTLEQCFQSSPTSEVPGLEGRLSATSVLNAAANMSHSHASTKGPQSNNLPVPIRPLEYSNLLAGRRAVSADVSDNSAMALKMSASDKSLVTGMVTSVNPELGISSVSPNTTAPSVGNNSTANLPVVNNSFEYPNSVVRETQSHNIQPRGSNFLHPSVLGASFHVPSKKHNVLPNAVDDSNSLQLLSQPRISRSSECIDLASKGRLVASNHSLFPGSSLATELHSACSDTTKGSQPCERSVACKSPISRTTTAKRPFPRPHTNECSKPRSVGYKRPMVRPAASESTNGTVATTDSNIAVNSRVPQTTTDVEADRPNLVTTVDAQFRISSLCACETSLAEIGIHGDIVVQDAAQTATAVVPEDNATVAGQRGAEPTNAVGQEETRTVATGSMERGTAPVVRESVTTTAIGQKDSRTAVIGQEDAQTAAVVVKEDNRSVAFIAIDQTDTPDQSLVKDVASRSGKDDIATSDVVACSAEATPISPSATIESSSTLSHSGCNSSDQSEKAETRALLSNSHSSPAESQCTHSTQESAPVQRASAIGSLDPLASSLADSTVCDDDLIDSRQTATADGVDPASRLSEPRDGSGYAKQEHPIVGILYGNIGPVSKPSTTNHCHVTPAPADLSAAERPVSNSPAEEPFVTSGASRNSARLHSLDNLFNSNNVVAFSMSRLLDNEVALAKTVDHDQLPRKRPVSLKRNDSNDEFPYFCSSLSVDVVLSEHMYAQQCPPAAKRLKLSPKNRTTDIEPAFDMNLDESHNLRKRPVRHSSSPDSSRVALRRKNLSH